MIVLVSILVSGAPVSAGDQLPQPVIRGLKNAEAVAVGGDGRIYISEVGDSAKDGEGRILVVDKAGKAVPFATGLDNPRGMVFRQKDLFVTDNKRVWRIDEKGKAVV